MSDSSDPRSGAAEKEAQMREHEREAREREGAEQSPDSRAADPADPDRGADAGRDDPRSGKPAPPGNLDIGGGATGGS